VEQREQLQRKSLRCNDDFLELLVEDFGIPEYALRAAFMSTPRELKAVAMIVCALAETTPSPERYVLRWARLQGKGVFQVVEEEEGA
jgi:hypothetical protein